MEIRFRYSEDALLIARRIWPDIAVVIGSTIEARTPAVEEDVPEVQRATYRSLTGRVPVVTGRIEALLSPAPPAPPEDAPPEPPAELLKLATAETLADPWKLNRLIDSFVVSLALAVEAALRRPDGDDKKRAAERLNQRWFGEGRAYLGYDSERQWGEVKRRFTGLKPDDTAAVATLGETDQVARVAALNAHFGRILGITEDDREPPTPAPAEDTLAQAMEDFLALMGELVSFANVAWPGSSAEAGARRMRLVGPYFEEVLKISAEASRRGKAAHQDEGGDGSGEAS